MHPNPVAGIILAAGKGTRMKSDLPKGLHRVCGLPMVELVGRAMKAAGIQRPVIVVGHGGEKIQEALGDSYDYVWQREQLGTGHAALMARECLSGHKGPVVIAPGDAPLLDASVIEGLIEKHLDERVAITVVTAVLEDPRGYGRVIRDGTGKPIKIVEEKDASAAQKAICEVNVSLYCFDGTTLFRVLPKLRNTNAQGEYYLTDTLEAIASSGGKATTFETSDAATLVGVNDRWQLALADRDLRLRILKRHALNGVTLLDIETVRIEPDVKIGTDTIVEASTSLLGKTVIGSGCRIGPGTRIESCSIGDGSVLLMTHAVEATVGSGVWCGPFANLRPGAVLGDQVKIGNFVEIKNSVLAEDVKVSHLSYIGDASIGEHTNVGAGTITCNYDGFEKNRTEIGSDAFIGSHSTLVAPVTIGEGSFVAAGSVVTKDVPDDSGAFGRARQENKEGWASTWRRKKQSESQSNQS